MSHKNIICMINERKWYIWCYSYLIWSHCNTNLREETFEIVLYLVHISRVNKNDITERKHTWGFEEQTTNSIGSQNKILKNNNFLVVRVWMREVHWCTSGVMRGIYELVDLFFGWAYWGLSCLNIGVRLPKTKKHSSLNIARQILLKETSDSGEEL